MSAQTRPQERPDSLESLMAGISSAELQAAARTPESLTSVMFAFHPWCPIPNVTLSGFTFGIQHVVLKRMDLVPLKAWKTPIIQPRASGFTVGSITLGGVFPSGAVGSKVEQQWQFPSESARQLLGSYGRGSVNDIGMVILDSLSADSDLDKLRSLMTFHAVMRTPVDEGGPVAVDLPMEYLPAFLKNDANKLLQRLVLHGMVVRGEEVRLAKGGQKRGELMIAGIAESINAATRRATDEGTGILPQTKRQLIGASKGLKDVKVLPDLLDTFLLEQFPSYSLDTDVERATRANRSVTDAIQASGKESALTLRELLDMQRQTLEQLAQANELNRQLMTERVQPETGGPPA